MVQPAPRRLRVLITGAAGRIGSALHARLRHAHDVQGLDLRPSACTDIQGSIGDRDVLAAALAGVDAVIHTAALHAPQVGVHDDREFQRVNVDATASLIELSRAAGVRQLIYTSTTALYGSASTPDGRAGWLDADTPPRPITIYHRTKLAAETLLEAASQDLSITVLRMSRCFPEPAPLMALYRLHRGVDARDVAEAHYAALGQAAPGFRRFVVSAATPFVRADASELYFDAAAVLRRRAPALVAAFARHDWPLPARIDRVYDAGATMTALSWRPRYDHAEVLAQWQQGSAEVLAP